MLRCFLIIVASLHSAATFSQPMSRLVWHRRDLRLTDNELYHNTRCKIYSVFIFDPSEYARRKTGIPDQCGGQLFSVNHGPHFSRRLIDAVRSLRCNLQSLGGDLIIRKGNPLQVLPQLACELNVEEVAWSEVPGYYEYTQSVELQSILQFGGPYKCNVFTSCSLTLTHPNDLPTDPGTWQRLARPNEKQKKRKSGKANKINKSKIKTKSNNDGSLSNTINVSPSRFDGMPLIMGDFRRVARTAASPRKLFDYPHSDCIATNFTNIYRGDIPLLDELTKPLLEETEPILGCIPKNTIDLLIQSANAIDRNNGNIEKQYINNMKDFVLNHAATADRSLCDVTNQNSSRLGLPLALGVLSPRQVYHCVKDEQSRLEQNERDPVDISWLISHMEMRDYFIFNHFRQGKSAYNSQPTKPVHKPDSPRHWQPLSEKKEMFIRWIRGETGLPLVDAGMKELITTGYTSNRVRQNMASVLTKDLQLDWRLGAEWYQLCLDDHCVAANFGNWAYFAGVGGDPKNRHFRTISQSYRYDPDGSYVRKWIKINSDDTEAALRPWAFEEDWPVPIVDPDTQLTFQDKERLGNTGRVS